jgi:cyanophycin synthetase
VTEQPPTAAEAVPAVSTSEVRLLEGPNLYFTRPAAKVTLRVPGWVEADGSDVAAACRAAGLDRVQPGDPGTGQRQRVVMRVLERVVRALAAAGGTRRLGVRVRPGGSVDEVVGAFVWRQRARAQALGESLGPVLAEVLGGSGLDEAVARHADALREATGGEPPRVVSPRIPVVSVTGTNGKTTTTRLLAHIAMTSGRRTAWSSTDGIVVQGEMVEPGDYSGPAGARGVLGAPGVQVGILETARGGMLLRGMGVSHNDVSVVTNVSADHLGLQGIDTLDQLAEVKAIVTRVTRPSGWVVLGGDDPRVWAMRHGTRARPWVFTADPDSPAVREALDVGGRAVTVLDDHVTVVTPDGAPDRLVRVLDVPMTLAGLARHNVLNALAGTAAALGLGLDRTAVVEGLRTFLPDDVLNPGRMNTYSVPVAGGGATVVVDLAHNEAGLEALLDVARGLVEPGSVLHLGLGAVGDRTDDLLESLGEIAGLRADHVVITHKDKYLRGRTADELGTHLLAGLGRAGVADVTSYATEVAGLEACVAAAGDGDVVALMCHAQRSEVREWLREHGATADTHDVIRRKVVRARGEHEDEAAIAALWAMEDDAARIDAGRALAQAHPGDGRVAYEYAGTFDSAGRAEEAVALYREALDLGLREPHRHRCRLQLASSLRNLGRLDEAAEVVDDVVSRHPDSLGAAMFRALVLHDAGRGGEALRDLMTLLATTSTDEDVVRYRRSLAAYASDLDVTD